MSDEQLDAMEAQLADQADAVEEADEQAQGRLREAHAALNPLREAASRQSWRGVPLMDFTHDDLACLVISQTAALQEQLAEKTRLLDDFCNVVAEMSRRMRN